MKKYTASILATILSMSLLLSSCGNTDNEKNDDETKQEAATTVVTTETTTAETTTTTAKPITTTTTTAQTTTTTVTTTAAPEVSTIGDRQVNYNDAEQKFEVLWVFRDQNKNAMKVEADIKIVIENKNGEEVYNKVTHVTKKDYTEWSFSGRDEQLLMGCVYIPIEDITPGSEDEGVLTLSAEGEGFSFDESSYNVYDLPLRQAQVKLPDVPLRVSDLHYNGEIDTTIEITEIITEFKDDDLILKFKCTMVYNSDGANEAQTGRFGYRLVDEDGVIEDSGTIYTDSLRVGDTAYAEKKFYGFDVDFSKDYTLELWNNE